jgi:AcrR family transcriptional regulator
MLGGIAAPGRAVGATFDAAAPAPAIMATAGDDDSDTRAAYLRAATRLVNQHGYRGASVDRIAAELRLTKGSFYHHHETKEELIAACFERTFAVVRAAQGAALGASGSELERLAFVCRALLAHQMSPHGPLLRITAWMGLPAALRDDARRTMGRVGERFAALVVDGMTDGSLRIVDPSIAAQVVNGLVNAAAELERWVPGADAGNAFELYAMPLFTGIDDTPGTPPSTRAARTTARVTAA